MNLRWVVLGALLASIAFATDAASARAADDTVALSVDGVTWGDTLSSPLFTRDHVWVPGDVETRSFYVRNDGPTSAEIAVGLQAQDRDRLIRNDDLVLAARAAGGAWRPLVNGGDVGPLVRGALTRGEVVRIDLRASFRWLSTNASMLDEVPLQLVVVLRQAAPDPADGGEPDGALPEVGSTVPWWLVALAVGLAVVGVLVVLADRRRRSRDE